MAKQGVEKTKYVIIAALIALILVIGYAVLQLVKTNSSQPDTITPAQVNTSEVAPKIELKPFEQGADTAEPALAIETPVAVSTDVAVELETSNPSQVFDSLEQVDDYLDQQLGQYLATQQLALIWQDDYLRRAVVYVDNLAQGKLVNNHNVFKPFKQPFTVEERNGAIHQSSANFKRYEVLVSVFEQLPNDWIIATYKQLLPNIDEIYQEIAPPNARFNERLQQVISMVLNLPEVPVDAELTSDSVVYTYQDSAFEKLTPAQKQLLRLGPQNVKRIQHKLKQVQAALNQE